MKLRFDERNPIYFPSLSGSYLVVDNLQLKHMFWRKECPIYYPRLLLSPFVLTSMWGRDASLKYKLDAMKIGEEVVVMTDSGGYQVIERGEKITALESLEAQLTCLSGREGIMFTLDYPVRPGMDEFEIKKAREATARNTEAMLREIEKMDGRKFMFYAVLQARQKLKLIDLWWKESVEPFLDRVDGVGVGVANTQDPLFQMAIYDYLAEKGVKNVHVFGVAGLKSFSSASLYSEEFDLITIDSSTPTRSLSSGAWAAGNVLSGRVQVGKNAKKMKIDYAGIKCYCPACRTFFGGDFKQFAELNSSYHWIIIPLHNLFFELCKLTDVKLAFVQGKFNKISSFMGVEYDVMMKVYEKGYKYYFENLERGIDSWL